jgi:hypothetical protein
MSKKPKPSEIAAALQKKLGFTIKNGVVTHKLTWLNRPASMAEEQLWRLSWRLIRERMTKTEDNECGCPVWGLHAITCRRSFA